MGREAENRLASTEAVHWFGLVLTGVCWSVVVALSVNRLLGWWPQLDTYSQFRGAVGWLAIVSWLFWLGRGAYLKQIVLVFLGVAFLGYLYGPYLEPPADPLDHLRNTHLICQQGVVDGSRTNRGYWQYSMAGVVLCQEGEWTADAILSSIDALHGLFWGLAAAVLYLVGRRAGLEGRWALFSLLVAWLFMGTGVFSYFQYYSFAPSFSSLLIYWLWIATFFWEKRPNRFFLVLLITFLLLPVLVVNHIQEAIFLLLVFFFWILINIKNCFIERIKLLRHELRKIFIIFFMFIVVGTGWVLPQIEIFQKAISLFFIHDYWQSNSSALVYFGNFHVAPRFEENRIWETLGLFGVFPVIVVLYFVIFSGKLGAKQYEKLLVLSCIPVVVYCIPLLNFIWLSNCVNTGEYIRYYYRICYASLFWLAPAALLQVVVKRSSFHIYEFARAKLWSIGVFFVSVVSIVVISGMRSTPVFGKLDFYLVDNKPWWPRWHDLIEVSIENSSSNVFTDYITGYVLSSVFGNSLVFNQFNITDIDAIDKRSPGQLDKTLGQNTVCLINEIGFIPSWVPRVSGHWSESFGDTIDLYSNVDDFVGYGCYTFSK